MQFYQKTSKVTIKRILLFVFLFLFLLTFNSGIIKNSLFSLSDEVFLFFSIIIISIFSFHQLLSKKIQKIYFILLLYIIYQFVNYFVSPFSLKLELVLLQSLINIKVFLVSFVILLIWQNNRLNKKIVKNIYFLFIALFIIGMLLNFVLQEKWNILLGYDDIRYRYGFISPTGWLGSKGQNIYFFLLLLQHCFYCIQKQKLSKQIFL